MTNEYRVVVREISKREKVLVIQKLKSVYEYPGYRTTRWVDCDGFDVSQVVLDLFCKETKCKRS